MEVYYAPVLLTLWALIAHLRRNRRLELAALVACAVSIALIIALRWHSDIDYVAYVDMYNDYPRVSELDTAALIGLYGEPGYVVVMAIFKSLGLQFALLALACAVSSLLLKSIVAYKLSRHASLALCLYLCLHFIAIEFIQMRWAVATSLLALGFYCQYMRRYKAAVLCFVLAPLFQFYSVLFWIVAVGMTVKGYRRFYLLLLVSLLAALFLKLDYVARFFISDSNVYVMRKITTYATGETDTPVGLLSYAKVLMYPVIYTACVRWRPALPWKTDRLNLFLFKLSFLSLSAALWVAFIPILHGRAVVVADFFAIIWILNALDRALSGGARTVAFAGIGVLYCTWYLMDLSHSVQAGALFEYQTWLTALP